MTDNHPITPPPEIVEQWHNEAMLKGFRNKGSYYGHELAIQAARWGADQELEACCADIHSVHGSTVANWLRAMRRPKPPSLKEQALKALNSASFQPGTDFRQIDPARSAIIRRALEQLPE